MKKGGGFRTQSLSNYFDCQLSVLPARCSGPKAPTRSLLNSALCPSEGTTAAPPLRGQIRVATALRLTQRESLGMVWEGRKYGLLEVQNHLLNTVEVTGAAGASASFILKGECCNSYSIVKFSHVENLFNS